MIGQGKRRLVGQAVLSRRQLLASLGLTAVALGPGLPAAQAAAVRMRRLHWITAWAATLQRQAAGVTLDNQTVRHVLQSTVAGDSLRIRLSNEWGTAPLQVGAVTVSVAGRTVPVVFGGQPSVTIPAMAPLVSDPITLTVAALQDVVVSIYLPGKVVVEAVQRGNDRLSVTTAAGDFTAQPDAPGAAGPAMLLSALEVNARQPCLVVVGDTKSAGPGNWVEFLPALARGRLAIANRSMFAGLMALGAPGNSVLSRLDRDVLSVAGATAALVYSGNNDLIQPGTAGSNGQVLMDAALALPVEGLIAHQQQAIDRCRAAGLQVVGGTWLPYAGVTVAGYATPEKLAKRDRINDWIRDRADYDLVIDFDAALRDPVQPQRLQPAFDSGNHFTPSEAGYRRMAEVAWPVLSKLRSKA